MKQTSIRFLLLTLLLSLTSLPALAETPWYKVEVLVFAHASAKNLQEQVWRNPKVPEKAGAIELGNGGSGAYQRLPASNLVLSAEKNRLARQAGYRTLFHAAWYQPVGDGSHPRPVHIRGGKLMPNGAYELDGYISVTHGRFLHLHPDLYYTLIAPAQYATASDAIGSTLLTVNLDTPRRMRSNEIHYLDNPLFGALVLIQK